MADPNDKVAGQPEGPWYVDAQCINCDLCRETAPANFQRNDEAGFSYIFKQPETSEEEALCRMRRTTARSKRSAPTASRKLAPPPTGGWK